jgi:nicotinamide-nucleotide amidase
MKIEIIAVGSELLTPFFIDTNSLYLTRRLNDLGLDPSWKTVVGDDPDDLAEALRDALGRAELLIVMGGLGPTGDDLTREVLADVLGRGLRFDEKILGGIRERFLRRGWEMTPSNRRQAFVIDGAEVLENRNGTAPGQWLESGTIRIALLPGPPRELEPMCEASVWPRLSSLSSGFLVRRILKTTGLGESDAEDRIRDLYPDQKDLKLTILASPGQIDLHLSARSAVDRAAAQAALDRLTNDLRKRLGERVFSDSGEELEQVVGRLLAASGKTLSVAESCSGGMIAERITRVPGSSIYFLEGAVTYSNAAKIRTLGVPAALIEAHGAVSAEAAAAMAVGIRAATGSDLGISVTGIAGPGGGTNEKPVGLVFAALAWEAGVAAERNVFFGRREQIRIQSTLKALDLVRVHLERSAGGRTGT